jgi:hypothetical protein
MSYAMASGIKARMIKAYRTDDHNFFLDEGEEVLVLCKDPNFSGYVMILKTAVNEDHVLRIREDRIMYPQGLHVKIERPIFDIMGLGSIRQTEETNKRPIKI